MTFGFNALAESGTFLPATDSSPNNGAWYRLRLDAS